jgi:hypothetical protein
MNIVQDSQLTPAQRMALGRIYRRDWDRPDTYRLFRETVRLGFGCIMVPWCGMWLGIEPDGHTHS